MKPIGIKTLSLHNHVSQYYTLIAHVRASPAVWQIELPSLIFGKNVKNTPPTVWQKTWQFLATWEKPASSA